MIRNVEPADLPQLVALEAVCFGIDAWSEHQLRDELSRDRIFLVSTDHDQLTGFIDISVAADVADLLRIAVHPQFRREGIANGLLDAGVRAVVARGMSRMILEVAEDNVGAIALYEINTFTVISRRSAYYRGNTDALVMERVVSS